MKNINISSHLAGLTKEACYYFVSGLHRKIGGEINFKPHLTDKSSSLEYVRINQFYEFNFSAKSGTPYFNLIVSSSNGSILEGKIEKEYSNRGLDNHSKYISKVDVNLEQGKLKMKCKLKSSTLNEENKHILFNELLDYVFIHGLKIAVKIKKTL